MKEVKVECPSCQQPIETDEETASRGLNCPGCYKFFTPKLPSLPDPPVLSADEIARRAAARLANRAEKIRHQADVFTKVAICCVLVGALALLVFGFSFSTGESGDVLWSALYFACGCFGFALWTYLVAQIIHIRANTEK